MKSVNGATVIAKPYQDEDDGGYMKVELLRANIGDAKELHVMQVKAFFYVLLFYLYRTTKSRSYSYC